jgi:acetolactate synthase-1/2/3 large subunit
VITYADLVAGSLADAGIEFIFGLPGSLSSVELIEAAAKRDIRYVLASNESSAAVMAGTYGIMRNRPGVLSTGVGPGAMAAVLGVSHLYLERAPCIVLTDRYGEAEFKRLPRQRLEQDRVFRPITKATYKLGTEDAKEVIQRALALAMDGRPGPVHVDLPYDVLRSEVGQDLRPAAEQRRYIASAGSNHPGLAEVAARIDAAQSPAIVVGCQVVRGGESTENAFRAFVEKLNVPVFASLGAKGTLPEHHPLSAGTFRGVESEKEILDKADLLVLLGFDPVEIFAPGVWQHSQPIISIDEVSFLEGPYRPDLEVVANLEDSLRVLAGTVSLHSGWNWEDVESYKNSRQELLNPTGSGLMPGAVIRLAREHLPDDGVVTVDAGQHKILASDIWQTRRPRGFLSSSGLGSMAVSIPAALAVKLVEPRTPVLCLVGDGGFLMRIGDLETAVREGLPIVVVVFNDRVLNLIKLQQDRRGYRRLGVNYADCDFATVARGLGFEAVRVESEAALDAALSNAFSSGGPWLIDTVINPDGYV